jgi:ABC-2 type transport system permease protein
MPEALRRNKKQWTRSLVIIAGLFAVNVLGFWWHARLDLTAEKRFTLSPGTRSLLSHLDGVVHIRVFLKGKFPAGFKELSESTQELLQEFRQYGGNHLEYEFINPGQGLPDSSRQQVYDSLAAQGIAPYNLQVQLQASEGYSENLIFPGAIVYYEGKQAPVDLLQSQGGLNPMEALNNADALLEYRFSDAIYRLSQKTKPLVGYMLGNGELLGPHVYDALNIIQQNYQLDTIDLAGDPFIPSQFTAVLFLGPQLRFTDTEKLKIDQYLMHGGKILWFINEVSASMDSLQDKNSFIAFDRGLNLEDLLFTYGVRINPDLVQDLQCDVIPLTVGTAAGKPQIQLIRWPYFFLASPASGHPVVKNLDPVLCEFASSIDTIATEGISKTLLLATSAYSRSMGTPSRVSWESVKIAPRPEDFHQHDIPVAVLLEGKFRSLFRNRFDPRTISALNAAQPAPFQTESPETKMIVGSSSSLITNAVTRREGSLPMGMNAYTHYQFANREFFTNSLEYLAGNTQILATRTKDFELRLLDQPRVAREKLHWQILNLCIPLFLVLLLALVLHYVRRYRYAR